VNSWSLVAFRFPPPRELGWSRRVTCTSIRIEWSGKGVVIQKRSFVEETGWSEPLRRQRDGRSGESSVSSTNRIRGFSRKCGCRCQTWI
jgi:hypothetical protein